MLLQKRFDIRIEVVFIDLVDLPRLDRDYTVFGYVVSGMEFVDRMLEGTRIRAITLRDK